MTRRAGFVVCALFLFAALAAPAAARAQGCLSYEQDGSSLSGRILRRTFAGPPNYQSVRRGDRPEAVWVLRLARPVCLNADPDNEMNVAERNVADVQLALEPAQYRRWARFAGKPVTVLVTGRLFHAHTGHHHTPVLMSVTDIRKSN